MSCAPGADATTGLLRRGRFQQRRVRLQQRRRELQPAPPTERRHRRGVRAHLRVLHLSDGLRRGRQRGTGVLLPGRRGGDGLDRGRRRPGPSTHVGASCAPGSPAGTTFCAAVDSGATRSRARTAGSRGPRPPGSSAARGDGTAARDLLPHRILLRRHGQRRQRLHGGASAAAHELRRGPHGRPRPGPSRPDPGADLRGRAGQLDRRHADRRASLAVQRATQRNLGHLAGANARTYAPVAADVGHRLRCVATATNAAGSTDAYSPATDVVLAAPTPPPVTVDPPITSIPRPARRPVPRVDAAVVAVHVRTRVTRTRVARGRTTRFTGWVQRARPGTPFTIQRLVNGEWRTVADGVTAGEATTYSVFSKHVRVYETTRYRVSCSPSTRALRRQSGGRSACPCAARPVTRRGSPRGPRRREPADTDQLVIPDHLGARRLQSRRELVELVNAERGMRLARRLKALLDTDVQLLGSGLEPHAAAGPQRLRLGTRPSRAHPRRTGAPPLRSPVEPRSARGQDRRCPSPERSAHRRPTMGTSAQNFLQPLRPILPSRRAPGIGRSFWPPPTEKPPAVSTPTVPSRPSPWRRPWRSCSRGRARRRPCRRPGPSCPWPRRRPCAPVSWRAADDVDVDAAAAAHAALDADRPVGAPVELVVAAELEAAAERRVHRPADADQARSGPSA